MIGIQFTIILIRLNNQYFASHFAEFQRIIWQHKIILVYKCDIRFYYFSYRVAIQLPGCNLVTGLHFSYRVAIQLPGCNSVTGLHFIYRVAIQLPGCTLVTGLQISCQVAIQLPGCTLVTGLQFSYRVAHQLPGCISVAGLLARSQYPEGPATGYFGKGISWFPCVYKRMLRWFPRLQVTTAYFSCSPPDSNFLDPYFIFVYMHYKHCHRGTVHLQLNICYYNSSL